MYKYLSPAIWYRYQIAGLFLNIYISRTIVGRIGKDNPRLSISQIHHLIFRETWWLGRGGRNPCFVADMSRRWKNNAPWMTEYLILSPKGNDVLVGGVFQIWPVDVFGCWKRSCIKSEAFFGSLVYSMLKINILYTFPIFLWWQARLLAKKRAETWWIGEV